MDPGTESRLESHLQMVTSRDPDGENEAQKEPGAGPDHTARLVDRLPDTQVPGDAEEGVSWAARPRPWDPALPEEGDSAGRLLGSLPWQHGTSPCLRLPPWDTVGEEGSKAEAWEAVPHTGLGLRSFQRGHRCSGASAVQQSLLRGLCE